ncbi:hypothetical protein BDL97_11G057400, partial [Sphagnum fallax]
TLGAFVAYNINFVANKYIFALKIGTLGNQLDYFLNKRWLFDKVFNDFIIRLFLRFGYEVSFKVLDKGAFEILRPYGISGFVYHYAFVMLIGLTIFITI